MESIRTLTQLTPDMNLDEMPEILTVYTKCEDITDSAQSEPTNKSSSFDIDQDTNQELLRKLQNLNDSITKEKEELVEEYEKDLQNLKIQNEDLEQENSSLKSEVERLQSKLEEAQVFPMRLQDLSDKVRELELLLAQKNEKISQLQESNKILSLCSKDQDSDDLIKQKLVEMDKKLIESLRETEDLKNQLISVNMMYAESETQKELIIKMYNDQARPNRFSWDFWKFWRNDLNN